MSWVYRNLLRPLLFAQDAEQAHLRTLRCLHAASKSEILLDALKTFYARAHLPTEVFGLKFPNPVGVAAGLDKHAEALPAWPALGFGFVELGGVTWLPQPGNPQPRIFRIPEDRAIINRMGFNNPGAEAFADSLRAWKEKGSWPKVPVGVNLGKSKDTPLLQAAQDYARTLQALLPLADFFVVNVSSPNTPNLRLLQDKNALEEILLALKGVQDSHGDSSARINLDAPHAERQWNHIHKPVLVKVAPDLSFEALDDILEIAGPCRIDGLVATNTTITRPAPNSTPISSRYSETGGLSGAPLAARSTEVIRHLYRETRGGIPIIGVGGIFSARDAWEKIAAGASLVQVYTGLVYEGPGFASGLVAGLLRLLEEQGIAEIRDVVGISEKCHFQPR